MQLKIQGFSFFLNQNFLFKKSIKFKNIMIYSYSKASNMSGMSMIENAPSEPLEFFKSLMKQVGEQRVIMNIATLDCEYGPMNRSVLYRDISDDGGIIFITERNSRKYDNLMKDNRISATMSFADMPAQLDATENACRDAHWQVRLMNAYAVELNEQQIKNFWKEEPVFAKIRSIIMECGKPCDVSQLIKKHDIILQEYENGTNSLPQTKTFTGFKIMPKIWDFYMSEEGHIGDRVQYKWQENGKWDVKHVCA